MKRTEMHANMLGLIVFALSGVACDGLMVLKPPELHAVAVGLPVGIWALAGPGATLSWVLPWLVPRPWTGTRAMVRFVTGLAAPPFLLYAVVWDPSGKPDAFDGFVVISVLFLTYSVELAVVLVGKRNVDRTLARLFEGSEA